jgi:hypothetical protein
MNPPSDGEITAITTTSNAITRINSINVNARRSGGEWTFTAKRDPQPGTSGRLETGHWWVSGDWYLATGNWQLLPYFFFV